MNLWILLEALVTASMWNWIKLIVYNIVGNKELN